MGQKQPSVLAKPEKSISYANGMVIAAYRCVQAFIRIRGSDG